MQEPRIYPNECVRKIVAFIPEGHLHARFLLDLGDQVIVLHEAVVAALVRAYAMVAAHPARRAVELEARRLGRGERKPGYAEWQLLETGRSEGEVLGEAMEAWSRGRLAACRGGR
ncbi:hypothetical protein CF15_07835 [Pyrodictium occultum]|uniref:Uncharacterized protein n=1 Tax=Pyrodictium occultum TaxID=2309 RepID=A0A0V8RX50_PYROC|nr:hypothetical protein [Pyrodictium occultum]KSW12611.1 hypothetical protein CF15_07835 [Pyrodictium occultum]